MQGVLLKKEGVCHDKVTPREGLTWPGGRSVGYSEAVALAVPGQLDPPAWASSPSEVSPAGRRRDRNTCVRLRGIINHLGNYSGLKSASS